MAFKDQPWETRERDLGDEAENQFQRWCGERKINFVRFGLERPPLQMYKLPSRLRYTPDFLLTASFVEVQGFGRDQTFKLKLDKHGCLHWWNDLHPVWLYIWDSHYRRDCVIKLLDFDQLLHNATIETFAEGKTYFAIPGDFLFAHGTDRIYAS